MQCNESMVRMTSDKICDGTVKYFECDDVQWASVGKGRKEEERKCDGVYWESTCGDVGLQKGVTNRGCHSTADYSDSVMQSDCHRVCFPALLILSCATPLDNRLEHDDLNKRKKRQTLP